MWVLILHFFFPFKTKIMVYRLHTFFPQDCSPAKLCLEFFNMMMMSCSTGNADDSKTFYMASPGTAGSVSVSLHPLVIMNISEHWTR